MSSDSVQRRLLAAVWFAAFAFVCVSVLFYPLTMAWRGVLLYIALPTLAAGIAGALWGRRILSGAETNNLARSLLGGVAVAACSFVIFAALFAVTLPFTERGWSLTQSGGLFVLTSTLGVLLAAPVVLVGGALAGTTLYLLGRKCFANH